MSGDQEALLKLAERCEREEPSRALNESIYTAITPVDGLNHDIEAPLYAASIDAAVTLVPEGWLLIALSDIAADGAIQCELGEPGRNLVAVSVCARTLALALCAAALRARAA